ncbi:unnamed protein product [Acanthosepion pharaonis]|uniref:Uncharacterized protein n=1 Tax=Acanthosepion pharaonis TaxID=158019 RepID=A0A812DCP2_ACAPH|nr:unnamed protein product [Sepia pharaonis]
MLAIYLCLLPSFSFLFPSIYVLSSSFLHCFLPLSTGRHVYYHLSILSYLCHFAFSLSLFPFRPVHFSNVLSCIIFVIVNTLSLFFLLCFPFIRLLTPCIFKVLLFNSFLFFIPPCLFCLPFSFFLSFLSFSKILSLCTEMIHILHFILYCFFLFFCFFFCFFFFVSIIDSHFSSFLFLFNSFFRVSLLIIFSLFFFLLTRNLFIYFISFFFPPFFLSFFLSFFFSIFLPFFLSFFLSFFLFFLSFFPFILSYTYNHIFFSPLPSSQFNQSIHLLLTSLPIFTDLL